MSNRAIFLLGLTATVLTSIYNIGIIAVDDYASYVASAIPAQNQGPLWSAWGASVHPSLSRIVLRCLARLAHGLGLESPVAQLRFILTTLGIFNFLTVAFTVTELLRAGRNERGSLVRWGLVLTGGYFLFPLLLGRAMVETLSLPFLMLGLTFATRYWQGRGRRWLLASVAALTLASLLRFQAGILFPVLLLLPAVRRDFRGVSLVALTGIALFGATGLLDVANGGRFHDNLRDYFEYNAHIAERHGAMPFYTFLALFVALSLPPTFLSRFRGLSWRQAYRPLTPSVLFFAVFVGAHTLSAHKEERFMIPILPVFLVLLAPLLDYFSSRPEHRWRLYYFGTLNAILLVVVSLSIPQKNIVALATRVEKAPSVHKLVGLNDALVLFPSAYVGRPLEISATTPEALEPPACDTWLVLREADRPRLSARLDSDWEPVGRFSPALPESLVVRLNPKRNARRGALEAYTRKGCRARHS